MINYFLYLLIYSMMDYLNSLAMDPCNHRNPSKRKLNVNKKSSKIKSKL